MGTAWAFFLFSFQVHEKSVLLPLMPMTVLMAGKHGLSKNVRAWVGFANLLGVWTMFPLLQRVDLRIPYYVLSLLWAYLLGLPPTSFAVYKQRERHICRICNRLATHKLLFCHGRMARRRIIPTTSSW